MPRVPGMYLPKLKHQALPTAVATPHKRTRRPAGYGASPGTVAWYTELDPKFSDPIMTEMDVQILREFRREMRACDERACLCTCHCHAGAGECYIEQGISEGNLSRFHYRVPNTAHKGAHR